MSSLLPTEGTESLQITIFSFKGVFLLGRKSHRSFVLASSFIKKKKNAGRWEHVWEHKKGSPTSSENRLFQTSDHPFFGNIYFFKRVNYSLISENTGFLPDLLVAARLPMWTSLKIKIKTQFTQVQPNPLPKPCWTFNGSDTPSLPLWKQALGVCLHTGQESGTLPGDAVVSFLKKKPQQLPSADFCSLLLGCHHPWVPTSGVSLSSDKPCTGAAT